MIIIMISIFIEDNVFSTSASLPYGPLVNTDLIIFGPFCCYSDFFHIRHAILVMLYFCIGIRNHCLPYNAESQAR